MVAQLQIILQKFKLIHCCADLQILSLLTKACSVCVMWKHFCGNRTLFPIAWVNSSPQQKAKDVKGPQNMQQVFIMEPKQREMVSERCSLTLLLKWRGLGKASGRSTRPECHHWPDRPKPCNHPAVVWGALQAWHLTRDCFCLFLIRISSTFTFVVDFSKIKS